MFYQVRLGEARLGHDSTSKERLGQVKTGLACLLQVKSG